MLQFAICSFDPLISVPVESGLVHVRYHVLSHIVCVMTIHYPFTRMIIQVFTFTVQKPLHAVLSRGGCVTSVIVCVAEHIVICLLLSVW